MTLIIFSWREPSACRIIVKSRNTIPWIDPSEQNLVDGTIWNRSMAEMRWEVFTWWTDRSSLALVGNLLRWLDKKRPCPSGLIIHGDVLVKKKKTCTGRNSWRNKSCELANLSQHMIISNNFVFFPSWIFSDMQVVKYSNQN